MKIVFQINGTLMFREEDTDDKRKIIESVRGKMKKVLSLPYMPPIGSYFWINDFQKVYGISSDEITWLNQEGLYIVESINIKPSHATLMCKKA